MRIRGARAVCIIDLLVVSSGSTPTEVAGLASFSNPSLPTNHQPTELLIPSSAVTRGFSRKCAFGNLRYTWGLPRDLGMPSYEGFFRGTP